MKTKLSLLLFVFAATLSAQNEKISAPIAELFFGFDITKKPEKIETRTLMPIDYGEPVYEQNKVSFTSHPLFKGEFKGTSNVLYLYDSKDLFNDYGLYVMKMFVYFKTSKDAKQTIEALKRKFKPVSFKVITTYERENEPKGETTVIKVDEDLVLPRIVIKYSKEGPHMMTIDVYTTWSFKKFKNYKGSFFD